MQTANSNFLCPGGEKERGWENHRGNSLGQPRVGLPQRHMMANVLWPCIWDMGTGATGSENEWSRVIFHPRCWEKTEQSVQVSEEMGMSTQDPPSLLASRRSPHPQEAGTSQAPKPPSKPSGLVRSRFLPHLQVALSWGSSWCQGQGWCVPKSPPTCRVPSRGPPRVPAPLPLSPFSPPDRDRRGDSPAWSGRGSRPSRRTSG